MKQKMTLGLLVFFLGILITACGSKKNNGGNGWNPDRDRFEDIRIPEDCNGRCERTVHATFYVEDKNEYADMFGYQPYEGNDHIGNVPDFESFNWESYLATIFIGNVLDPLLRCGSTIITAKLLRKLLRRGGNAEVRAFCRSGGGYDDDIDDSYGVDIEFNFDERVSGNGIDSIDLKVKRDRSRDLIEFDRRQSDHVFYDHSGDYELEIDGDRIYITGPSNTEVGFIEK